MTAARLRARVLTEIYGEPYVYRRADLYAAIPATRDDIDAAIAELIASGDIHADHAGDLMLTEKQTRERAQRMDEQRRKKGAHR